MELVNPALTEAKRRGGQPQQAQVRIDLLKVADNLLILAVIIVADAVALVDDQQRKLALKLVRLRATDCTLPKTTLPWLSLRLRPAAKISAPGRARNTWRGSAPPAL
jgi:hypothetical protein